jgi:hypothetical protein
MGPTQNKIFLGVGVIIKSCEIFQNLKSPLRVPHFGQIRWYLSSDSMVHRGRVYRDENSSIVPIVDDKSPRELSQV